MDLAGHVIGVCSWSLHCKGTAELVELLRALKLCHVQMMLSGLIAKGVPAIDELLQTFEKECINLTSGMLSFDGEDYSTIQTIRATGGFAPDNKWDERRRVVEQAAKCGQRMRLPHISTHIGFVPSSKEPGYDTMVHARARSRGHLQTTPTEPA